jgi:hypothetical protein
VQVTKLQTNDKFFGFSENVLSEILIYSRESAATERMPSTGKLIIRKTPKYLFMINTVSTFLGDFIY